MLGRETEMIFFDAGETLIHPVPSFLELFSTVCSDFQLEIDLLRLPRITRRLMSGVEEKQRNGFTFTNDSDKSRFFWLEFYSSLVGELGYSSNDGELPKSLYRTFSDPSNYNVYPDVRGAFDELRRRGMRLGLISNFEAWLEDLLEELGLSTFFEVMVISGKEDVEKPHSGIFELALERGGISPHQAMHVGDSPVSDLEGALNAGMQAVLIDRWGRFPHIEGMRVKDLREIPAILE